MLSKSEFAKKAGVSRQRIYQMLKDNNLVADSSGKLDTENRTNKNYLIRQDRPDGLKTSDEIKKAKQKKKTKMEKAKPNKKGNQTTDKKKQLVKATKKTITIIEDEDEEEIPMSLDKYKLQCKKLEADIKKIDIINAEKRNDLIPRDLVKQFIDEIYQIDSQEFLQLSSTLTAKICQGVFKSDDDKKLLRVSKLIDNESYKTLGHIQKKIDIFLTKLEIIIKKETA